MNYLSTNIKYLRSLKGLSQEQFADDFIDRVAISLEQIAILIKVNAFQFTKRNKRELLWEAHMKVHKVCLEENTVTLFKSENHL